MRSPFVSSFCLTRPAKVGDRWQLSRFRARTPPPLQRCRLFLIIDESMQWGCDMQMSHGDVTPRGQSITTITIQSNFQCQSSFASNSANWMWNDGRGRGNGEGVYANELSWRHAALPRPVRLDGAADSVTFKPFINELLRSDWPLITKPMSSWMKLNVGTDRYGYGSCQRNARRSRKLPRIPYKCQRIPKRPSKIPKNPEESCENPKKTTKNP